MSRPPTPRQVLYAVVSGGFLLVVTILTVGAATARIVPGWWSISMAVLLVVGGISMAVMWRRTALVLGLGIGIFLIWMMGTLVVSR